MILYSIPVKLIVILACFGVIILTCLFLLAFFNIKKKRQDKHVALMKQFIEKDRQEHFDIYLNKLRNVSEKNNQYVDIYNAMDEKMHKIFFEDKDTLLYKQDLLMKRCKVERYSKKLTLQIKALDEEIELFRKSLDDLQNDFEKIFNAGDKLRIKANDLKDKFKSAKEDLDKYQPSLQTCYTQLVNFLNDTDEYFENFEEFMSCAKYDKAQEMFDIAEKRIFNVYGNVELIANYNNMILEIIPGKLNELIEKKNELENANYVVNHTHIEDFVENSKKALKVLENQFSKLYFAEYEDVVNQIQEKINEAYDKLDKEVSNKNELEERYPTIEAKLTRVETDFIGSQRQFNNVNQYYQLSNDVHARFKEYISMSTELSNMKREYEGYLFVNSKNPASFMLEKASKMDTLADEIISEIEFFESYFKDIKKDVESIYEKTHELEISLIQTLGNINYNKAYPVYNKYRPMVDELLAELKNIDRALHETPIKVDYLHDEFSRLHDNVNEIRQRMINEMNSYSLLERSLIYANSLRYGFNEVDKILKMAESFFMNGSYKEAQERVNYVLNNYHSEAYDSFTDEEGR